MFAAISIIYTLFIIGIILAIIISSLVNLNRYRKGMEHKSVTILPFGLIVLLIIGLSFLFSYRFPTSLISILIMMIITFVSILTLNQLYRQMTDNKPHVFHTILYLFTLLSIAGTGLGYVMNSDGLVFIIEDILGITIANVFMIISFSLCVFVLNKLLDVNWNFSRKDSNKKVSNDMIQHYRDAGLSDDEITYLRDQLAQLREHILVLEEQMNKTAKLRAIDVRNNTIEISQQFFKAIVNEPKRFGEAGDVIYRIIPSLVDLTEKYNEVNEHIAKNKQTYVILEKSAQTINNLAQRLTEEYFNFHKSTFQDLDDEINLAKRNLDKTQKWEKSPDSVDDILDEWNNNSEESEEE
ncbi:5-bromo-4-chloroindolyl phosphate hydrolysis family protein [Aerococcaceae bacterium WGS1372]